MADFNKLYIISGIIIEHVRSVPLREREHMRASNASDYIEERIRTITELTRDHLLCAIMRRVRDTLALVGNTEIFTDK